MVKLAREENELLKARLDALEARLAAAGDNPGATPPPSAPPTIM